MFCWPARGHSGQLVWKLHCTSLQCGSIMSSKGLRECLLVNLFGKRTEKCQTGHIVRLCCVSVSAVQPLHLGPSACFPHWWWNPAASSASAPELRINDRQEEVKIHLYSEVNTVRQSLTPVFETCSWCVLVCWAGLQRVKRKEDAFACLFERDYRDHFCLFISNM